MAGDGRPAGAASGARGSVRLIDVLPELIEALKRKAASTGVDLHPGRVDTAASVSVAADVADRLLRRFLDAVEDTVASSKTPLSVKETMLRVLGVLAFEFRADAELPASTRSRLSDLPQPRLLLPLLPILKRWSQPARGMASLQ